MGYHILKMLLKWLSMLDSLDVYMSEHPPHSPRWTDKASMRDITPDVTEIVSPPIGKPTHLGCFHCIGQVPQMSQKKTLTNCQFCQGSRHLLPGEAASGWAWLAEDLPKTSLDPSRGWWVKYMMVSKNHSGSKNQLSCHTTFIMFHAGFYRSRPFHFVHFFGWVAHHFPLWGRQHRTPSPQRGPSPNASRLNHGAAPSPLPINLGLTYWGIRRGIWGIYWNSSITVILVKIMTWFGGFPNP